MSRIQCTPARLRYILAVSPLLLALAATALCIGTGPELADFYLRYSKDHPNLTFWVTLITHLGNPLLYGVYGVLFWKARKNMDTALKRKVFAYITVQILISFALVRVLKMGFGMPRPDIAGPATPFTMDHGHHSFPSGHTTEIVGATLPLAWWAKSYLPSLAIGFYIAIVAYSRIYLGMHHIMDVLAGLLLGSFAAWCIHRLANRKNHE